MSFGGVVLLAPADEPQSIQKPPEATIVTFSKSGIDRKSPWPFRSPGKVGDSLRNGTFGIGYKDPLPLM